MHDDDIPTPRKERHGLDGDVEKTCENCRYFAAQGESSTEGDCRRHAPGPGNIRIRRLEEDQTVRLEPWWPVVCSDDWCGEFEPIDETEW